MIWCVEDDAGIRDIEVYALQSGGLPARGFSDGSAFWAALQTERPDLVILDVMLPGTDGITCLKKLKASPAFRDIPVIMATAKGQEYDKVQALDLGADYHLAKPFGMMELVSAVKAVLRRYPSESKPNLLTDGAVSVNIDEHTVSVDGQRIQLTLKEFEILRLFLSNPGLVFTREQLFNTVWELPYCGETRTVDMHIRTLRQKLSSAASRIETVRGVGYRWETAK